MVSLLQNLPTVHPSHHSVLKQSFPLPFNKNVDFETKQVPFFFKLSYYEQKNLLVKFKAWETSLTICALPLYKDKLPGGKKGGGMGDFP